MENNENKENPKKNILKDAMSRRDFIKITSLLAGSMFLKEKSVAQMNYSALPIEKPTQSDYNYDYDLFDQIYLRNGVNVDKLPIVNHSQLWWFNDLIQLKDYENETAFIKRLLTQGKIDSKPILPILQFFYVFPILAKENSRIQGEALQKYFQPNGNNYNKIINRDGSIVFNDYNDITNTGLAVDKKELQHILTQNRLDLENLKMFTLTIFNTLPLHLLDYMERIDVNGESKLHFHFKEPYSKLKIKFKKELIKELLQDIPLPIISDIEGEIKWDQNVYMNFKTFVTKTPIVIDSKTMSLDKKTLIFKDLKGISINPSFATTTLTNLGAKTLQIANLPIPTLSEILKLENYYLSFTPESSYSRKSNEITLDNIRMCFALPNRKANIAIDKMSIQEIYYDSSYEPDVYFGPSLEALDSIKPFLYIYGEDKTQRLMRALALISPIRLVQDELKKLRNAEPKYKVLIQEISKTTGINFSKTQEEIDNNILQTVEKIFDFNFRKLLLGEGTNSSLKIKNDKSVEVKKLHSLLKAILELVKEENDVKVINILLKELETGVPTNLKQN